MIELCVSPAERLGADTAIQTFTPVRQLGGFCHSVLVRENASDTMWVLKPDNGAHVLANEIIGTHLFSRMGIPVPEQRIAMLAELPSAHETFWRRGRLLTTSAPQLQLLIRHLPDQLQRVVFEVVPPEYDASLSNVGDFLGTFLIDMCIGNVDVRQSLFVPDGNMLQAVFIDHSHIFGGPDELINRRVRCKRSFNHLVLEAARSPEVVAHWTGLIEAVLLVYLREALALVPQEWQRREFCSLSRRVGDKVKNLKNFLPLELERIRQQECRENMNGRPKDLWLGL